jgi:hypothetical protein
MNFWEQLASREVVDYSTIRNNIMATPQPPLTPEQRIALEERQKLEKLGRYAAIGGVILCPALALMPPRKLDLYTLALGISTYISADYLCNSYTGRGVVENVFAPRWRSKEADPYEKGAPLSALPTPEARKLHDQYQKKLRELEIQEAQREGKPVPPPKKGILQQLWMGDEEEGWKERRLEEERKALAEGKGYSGIIMDQIWEVWNWDKKKKPGEEEASSTNTNEERKKP